MLPRKPLRQWVLSLPFALRFLLAINPEALTLAESVGSSTMTYYAFYQIQGTGQHPYWWGGVTLAWGPATKDSIHVDTGSYLVRVASLSIDEQFESLLSCVKGVGPGKSLANKVALAQTYYAVPDVQATCAVLTGFVNEVRAQRGKKIALNLADKLTADARVIMSRIGCS